MIVFTLSSFAGNPVYSEITSGIAIKNVEKWLKTLSAGRNVIHADQEHLICQNIEVLVFFSVKLDQT